MTKKYFNYLSCLVFSIIIAFITIPSLAADDLTLVAESAILIDAETGQVLYEKNAHREMYPASTTKIMTLILGIEHTNLDDRIVVDEETPYEVRGSHIALEPHEVLTAEQLLDAIAISSANDAAMVMARHISNSIDNFNTLMNKKAVEVGALNTHFKNPSGLPDEDHVTTAYDLALIAKYGLENPTFRELVTKTCSIIPPTNIKEEKRYLNTSNRMLFSNQKIDVDGAFVPIRYDGVTGIKTGFTNDAQHCLVASAKRDGREYISVVLKSERTIMYSDTHKLLNYAFENFQRQTILPEDIAISSIDIDGSPLEVGVENSFYLNSRIDSPSAFSSDIHLYEDLASPIEKGSIVGRVNYIYDGDIIGSDSLLAMSSLACPSILSFKLDNWIYVPIGLSLFLLVIFMVRLVYVRKKNTRRGVRFKKTRTLPNKTLRTK